MQADAVRGLSFLLWGEPGGVSGVFGEFSGAYRGLFRSGLRSEIRGGEGEP